MPKDNKKRNDRPYMYHNRIMAAHHRLRELNAQVEMALNKSCPEFGTIVDLTVDMSSAANEACCALQALLKQ